MEPSVTNEFGAMSLSGSPKPSGRLERAMTPGASFRNLAEMQSSQVLGMTSGPTIRSQLDSLAMTVHEVVGRVELSGRSIINLEEDRDRLKQVIQTQDDILNQRIVAECNNVRDDMNHKFALQVAENKRLQNQLAKSQADIQRLTRICENLATRVQILEANTGVQ